MRKFSQAPPLPGAGNPRNLLPQADGFDACPCCGAVWKGGRPWSETTLSPTQMADQIGMTPQAVTMRIRMGSIAAYLASGTGKRNSYLIPVFEAQRVMAQDPLEGGINPNKTVAVQDLGVNRGRS